jgi:hypothetical protein
MFSKGFLQRVLITTQSLFPHPQFKPILNSLNSIVSLDSQTLRLEKNFKFHHNPTYLCYRQGGQKDGERNAFAKGLHRFDMIDISLMVSGF